MDMGWCNVIGLLAFYVAVVVTQPRVKTPYGEIQGIYGTSYNGKQFSQFLGVPYAEPPIGDLRFEVPQPLEKWSGIWNANFSTHCIQVNHQPEPEGGILEGQEDCLYLNIFVPHAKGPHDVIVHIHGGAFNFGGLDCYAGPGYLMDADVVLVTINYRLGPLGFLSAEDEVIPGNVGMKDQSAALKWIKENVEYFGGNPESITISGFSAGGASVHYHYLSPLSKGLFHRGISVSGTALAPWSLQENAREKAHRLAAALGCPTSPSEELLKCLKDRPAVQIVDSVRMFRPWLYNPFSPFGIVVEKSGDGAFLNEHPYVLLSQGNVLDLPWLTSVASAEGLYPAADFLLKDHYLDDLEERWEELAPAVLDYNYTLSPHLHSRVAELVKEFYLKGEDISPATFDDLVEMIGDRHFFASAEKASKLQADKNESPVYFYYFNYMGEKVGTFAALWSTSEHRYGVSHGDDLAFVFSSTQRKLSKMTSRDEKMKDIDMWKSFAHGGVPKVDDVKWEPVSDEQLHYLRINSPEDMELESPEDFGNRAFWDKIPFREDENFGKAVKDEL